MEAPKNSPLLFFPDFSIYCYLGGVDATVQRSSFYEFRATHCHSSVKYIPVFALLGFPRKPAGFRGNPSSSFGAKFVLKSKHFR